MENLMSYYLLLIPPLLFYILLKHYFFSSQSHQKPPSPPSLPLIGHFHLITNSFHLSLGSLSARYGPLFSLRLGCRSFLVVSSPSAVAECFTNNDIVFANRPRYMAADLLSYNYAHFASASYGDHWRILRRLSVVEMFSSHSLQKSTKTREEEIRKIARVLSRVCRNRVDLNNLISTYTYNILMRALAGKSCVGEEDIGSEAGKETIRRIKGVFIPAIALGICDYFPVLRWIGYKGLEKNLIGLHYKRDEVLQSLIDEFREKNDVVEGERKNSLIGTLISLQQSEPDFYTDDVIKSFVLVLISAGTDTSGLTIEWAMSLLLSHPHELQKLTREIEENVGHDHLLNETDIPNLPYLSCVVNETLRLHPAAPLLLPHYSSEDCMVSGYNVPKGTILLVNAWAMHRDPKVWDEPELFKPERFEVAEMEREGYKFVPFGVGRRACPGAAMAVRTISLALGVFLQCFEWEKPLEDEEMDFSANLQVTLHKKKPLEAVCIPRKQAAHLLSQL